MKRESPGGSIRLFDDDYYHKGTIRRGGREGGMTKLEYIDLKIIELSARKKRAEEPWSSLDFNMRDCLLPGDWNRHCVIEANLLEAQIEALKAARDRIMDPSRHKCVSIRTDSGLLISKEKR